MSHENGGWMNDDQRDSHPEPFVAELLAAEARGEKRGREEENGACAALVSLCATMMMSADDTVTAILSRMADKESGKSVEQV